ncbi:FecCD family ABC transporter permease [Methanococcus maripaludis]|uniref:Iron ABC transporter permease n=1 Tax=Methanococcus maripaludis TaxID=39152 RepID=A0A8T3W8C6_METMI|nr:iron ABC transporter permease [Methanococcus maripaludis]MBG0769413.1 iron ABC transporter permease [Methanococcus maripaludis]
MIILNKNYVFPFLFAGVFLFSLFVGRYMFDPSLIFTNSLANNIFFDIRLPRAIAVSLAGASLALAGVSFQNIFKNYLAGPNILGVTSGSAFGASIAILFFAYNPYLIQFSAFIFGVIAVYIAYKLSSLLKSGIVGLILSGMAISAFFSAMIGLIKYVADPYEKLPTIVFWLLGSFVGLRWVDLGISVIPMLIGIIGLVMLKWVFNILATGDENAKSLGVDSKKLKNITIFLATLAASASTSLAGMIQWVGVVSPHIARLLVGVDNRKLVPASAFVGATLLLLCDTLARTLTPSEIPISIITSFIGAPILIIILSKRGVK